MGVVIGLFSRGGRLVRDGVATGPHGSSWMLIAPGMSAAMGPICEVDVLGRGSSGGGGGGGATRVRRGC